MTNLEYVTTWVTNPEAQQRVLTVLDGYGSDKWWLDDDIRKVAYRQLFEAKVVSFSRFHKGVERLLGRPVWTHEFWLCIESLRAEAVDVMLGIDRTEAEKVAAIQAGMEALQRVAEAKGIPIIGIQVSPTEEE